MVVFAAVLSFVIGLRDLRGGAESVVERRLESFRSGRETVKAEEKGPTLRRRSYSGVPVLSGFLAQFRGSEQVALHLERAGVPLRVGEFYMIRYALAVVLFLAPFLFSRGAFAFFFAVGLAVVGYMLPALYISSKKAARRAKIDGQLVEMLGLVANSLKSGYGLMQSFEFGARQMQPPLALELRRMLRDANLGLSAEESLNALGERIDSPDLEMVLTAINIQRAVGGNLAEVLEQVAFTMRERERIRGEIRTLTSQQKMTGIVIGGLPVGLGLLFMLINPDYMGLLFTEMAGRMMLVAAVGLEVLGIVFIKKILAIEV